MHVHLPKPLHGWREFVGEVGIIVLGVLIALGSENLIEDLRWHHRVNLVEAGLKDEVGGIAGNSYERLILQPCIKSRISEMGLRLRSFQGKWKGSPMLLNTGNGSTALLRAYRVPNRPLVSEIWLSAESSGTLSHMPRDRVVHFATIYGEFREFHDLQEDEARAAARLAPLAYDLDLSSDKRIDMLAALGDVDRINGLMAFLADQIIDKVRRLKLGFAATDVASIRRGYFSGNRMLYGPCVANRPLPI